MASYSFPVEEKTAWLRHLQDEGYVVIQRVLNDEQVLKARDLLWTDLERLSPTSQVLVCRHCHLTGHITARCPSKENTQATPAAQQDQKQWKLSRDDPSTWHRWKLSRTGLVPQLAQSAGAWEVRAAPKIKEVYAHIWQSENLIVSMDCVLIWKPWWYEGASKKKAWLPTTEGLHLDQNPFSKPALETVQGMVPLLRVTEQTGGLEVVPRSHTPQAQQKLKEEYKHWSAGGDWCPLHADRNDSVLLLCSPGDLILWDSRTVHGGLVGSGQATPSKQSTQTELKAPAPSASSPASPSTDPVPTEEPRTALARMSVTVSMVEASRADEGVLRARLHGFKKGLTFNHSPHEAGTSSGTVHSLPPKNYKPISLTPAQRALLMGNSSEPTARKPGQDTC
jgi:hypothetical protein